MKASTYLILILATAGFLISSCGQQNENVHPGPSIKTKVAGDITYGTDTCEWCHTGIEVVRYGAELIKSDGGVLKFKAAEHMAAWMLANPEAASIAKSVLVVDFADGDHLIDVKQALYLHSRLRPSPGKLNITPVNRDNQRMLSNIYDAFPGSWLEWGEVMQLVSENSDQLNMARK